MNMRLTSTLLAFVVVFIHLSACSNAVEDVGSQKPGTPDTIAPQTTADPPPDTWRNLAYSVSLSCADSGGSGCKAIYYTVDGSEPTRTSSVYAAPIPVNTTIQLRFFAVDQAGNAEPIQALQYLHDTQPPSVSATPSGRSDRNPISVTLTCSDGGSGCATIHYAFSPYDPDINSTPYDGNPIIITRTRTLKYFAVDIAGNSSPKGAEHYIIDTTAPTGSFSPASGSIIGKGNSLVITFSESMNTDSVVINEEPFRSGQLLWSTTTFTNDTLTIAPPPGSDWGFRLDSPISLVAQDLAGNTSDTITATYDVGIIHVSVQAQNASDSNPGTREEPLSSIQEAVRKAGALLGQVNIHVAEGEYAVDSQNNGHIIIMSEIALMGGIPLDWNGANPELYTTIIRDINATGSIDPDNPSCAVELSGDAVRIENFTIIGAANGNASAITVSGSANPTIRYNIIRGGDSNSGYVYGIFVDNASPRIEDNSIQGGSAAINSFGVRSINGAAPNVVINTINGGTASNEAVGVKNENSTGAIISYNEIYGGTATVKSAGIQNDSSNVSVTGNYVDGGSSGSIIALESINSTGNVHTNIFSNSTPIGTSYAIVLNNDSSTAMAALYNNIVDPDPSSLSVLAIGVYFDALSHAVVTNNIIVNGDYCIKENGSDAHPISFYNNDLFGCTVAYLDAQSGCTANADGDNNSQTCTLEEMQALTNMPQPLGNVSVDPAFADTSTGDYHFSIDSPTMVTTGGRIHGPSDQDKDGVLRTEPWSMGAYEYDAP